MPAAKKRVGLAVIVAITTAMNTFIAVPAFPQSSPLRNSPSSTYTPSDNQGDNNSNISALDVARPILIGGVAALALTTLGLATALLSGKNKEQLEELLKSTRETVNAVKRSQSAFNFSASRPQTTDEVHSSLSSIAAELIENYHTQALTQAAAQFWFSVSAATIGFLFIMYIGFFYSLRRQPHLTLLNTLPGIAIEAVAALFFKQAEETRKRATELYDRLRLDDKQTQAITLIESIENQELRDFVKAQWALQIVGLEPQPVDLSPYSYKLPLPNHSISEKDEQNKTSVTQKESPSTRQFIR
ncbi:hypothetical protein SD81_009420 [Tolypothrix campylonemoides VB511288]|nr:hypothetical protein SD81_009420 [Tolypothrix campylonemoides VB511288]